ncbi:MULTISPECIES: aldehyde dehydrogenase family protein [Sphingomonadales]|jgi:aldehyde dehydrogenase (NAD+)|uniref:aldehyde dehydrogenase family protein n=1 Tax=Sphingomonadales TaxID=204457 RepID=UPI00082407C4|nr:MULTISPECIES: aldehyde dehydrogenase family protein [Sphingomonadales]MBY0621289.1 aldehyde dehydrogenase family protein [Sphingomonas ursincola]
MRNYLDFYIDGAWVPPAEPRTLEVFDPATEGVAGRISMGGAADVDRAVQAARRAFESYGRTSRAERLDLLDAVLAQLVARKDDLAAAITEEMGAPAGLAAAAHVPFGLGHFQLARQILAGLETDRTVGTTLITAEPIGVVGMITPWNWPLNQIACKVAPALAVGCTMVLKPSEVAPFSAQIFAEALHAAGVPHGVFNLVNGDGPSVGAAISSHPGVDMVSFTGSTRAGVQVACDAAPTVKRVHQELGGKSANIILPDADLADAVARGVEAMMVNSGQSCNAPSRMLVPISRMEEAKAVAAQTIAQQSVGSPQEAVALGPVVSQTQWDRIQALIAQGIAEGATLVAGGTGRPDGLDLGYYVKPTVFADVTNDMAIAREEIFGPVVVLIGYCNVDEAVAIANDSVYGLAAYVQSASIEQARAVASRLRAGQVLLNYAALDLNAPFGGFKQSGNGREWGELAFHEFMEVKAVLGYEAA